jgi:hypothetical protein
MQAYSVCDFQMLYKAMLAAAPSPTTDSLVERYGRLSISIDASTPEYSAVVSEKRRCVVGLFEEYDDAEAFCNAAAAIASLTAKVAARDEEIAEVRKRLSAAEFAKTDWRTSCIKANRRAESAEAEVARLENQLQGEIFRRPEWAQGYTDDSIAAQVTSGSIRQLWKALGANNQTEAIQAAAAKNEERSAIAVEALRRRIQFGLGQHWDRVQEWENLARQALRWLEDHERRYEQMGGERKV